jgi:hypothetical protein
MPQRFGRATVRRNSRHSHPWVRGLFPSRVASLEQRLGTSETLERSSTELPGECLAFEHPWTISTSTWRFAHDGVACHDVA